MFDPNSYLFFTNNFFNKTFARIKFAFCLSGLVENTTDFPNKSKWGSPSASF